MNRLQLFWAGLLVIGVANGVALACVALNRRGPAESSLVLSQRELQLPFESASGHENSGASLHLSWRMAPPVGASRFDMPSMADWLNADKLQDLGIPRRELDAPPGYEKVLPRDVLLVLELNGPTYQRVLEAACPGSDADAVNAVKKSACQTERDQASRLFVVDAGLDREVLRRQYPDRQRYAIVRGRVEAWWRTDDSGRHLNGLINGVASDDIHVPKSLFAALERRPSQFEAHVDFGQRLEPWLVSIEAVP